ncbi:speckle-type POZ protein-like [Belonocnema kinseyi]|uniref:speckle-type POZ protein-like n=1 Tax=Belonocnema kinseyi TaxID=2817044 RepID=UPI00143D7778|nr:speckle-type POZ protein-like [Belonocnema kinseyi]XP_033212148.1 speckle-type POZ protein-like [Belonocnema kinseyi]XP_033212153.1 speckle-type POZ protein-like [Belonocnema kinseyi]
MGDTEFHRNSTFSFLVHDSVSFEWKIKSYNSIIMCNRQMKKIQSPLFSSKPDDKRKWYIEFVPKKIISGSTKELHIKLYRTDQDQIYVQACIFLKTATSERLLFDCDNECILYPGQWISFQENIGDVADELGWHENTPDILTIGVEIRTYFHSEVTHLTSIPKQVPLIDKQVPIIDLESRSLIADIATYFEDPTFKDVSFFIRNKEFTAHKNILASRSEVFATMFRVKMSEGLTSKVEVEDIEPVIFEKMLRFIYSDKVDDLKPAEASPLFFAAHKYDLEKLKNICIKSLYENLSIENVIQTLLLADLYSLGKLRESAMKFLVFHHSNLRNTYEFYSMVQSHPHFALELLQLQASSKL